MGLTREGAARKIEDTQPLGTGLGLFATGKCTKRFVCMTVFRSIESAPFFFFNQYLSLVTSKRLALNNLAAAFSNYSPVSAPKRF